MAVIVSKGIVVPYYGPPVGTTWLYEENGTFTVPADGIYQVEMHGGGGGGVARKNGGDYANCSGGGSGELQTVQLQKGADISITIGAGGSGGGQNYEGWPLSGIGEQGGTTTFGDLSVAGGHGGHAANYTYKGGAASGNIATAVTYYHMGYAAPGYGNKDNKAQTYGNGGQVNNGYAQNGKPGAVIITFKGVA